MQPIGPKISPGPQAKPQATVMAEHCRMQTPHLRVILSLGSGGSARARRSGDGVVARARVVERPARKARKVGRRCMVRVEEWGLLDGSLDCEGPGGAGGPIHYIYTGGGSGGSLVFWSSIVAFPSTLHIRKKRKEKENVFPWALLCRVRSVPTGCDRYKANCQPLVSCGGQRFHAMDVEFAYW